MWAAVSGLGTQRLVALLCCLYFFFFFQAEDGIRDVAVTGVQTCPLPILGRADYDRVSRANSFTAGKIGLSLLDRKSTRLNSSHGYISYAVFCLKKKKKKELKYKDS